MATKKSKKVSRPRRTAKPAAAGGGAGDDATYVRLRTVLDSVEIGAIRYYLMANTGAQRQQRFNELNNMFMPIVDFLWHVPDVDCPEGYMDCQGVCVPYPCPN